MNRNSLYYLEHLDAFEIMESHIMDRVMQEYWQSNLDASGNLLEASTAYGILTHRTDRYQYDYEQRNRFYAPRDQKLIRPNKLSFNVMIRSMQVRYFLEVFIYFVLSVSLQLSITGFSEEYNKMLFDMNNVSVEPIEGRTELENIEARTSPFIAIY